jgi:hypothetical protein
MGLLDFLSNINPDDGFAHIPTNNKIVPITSVLLYKTGIFFIFSYPPSNVTSNCRYLNVTIAQKKMKKEKGIFKL